MLKQPIYYEFNLDAKTSPSKLIAISHVDDKYSEVIEVAVKQNDRFVYMGGATVIARMVLHRDKDYLLSDDVPCTVNGNGNILIPFDNAVVKTQKGIVKIEVSITRDTDELTLQFPLWVSVNGSILDNAEVTPESKGTIPDLLKEAADALEDATEALGRLGSYSNLEDKPQIDGVTLDGDQTPEELGLQKELTAGANILIDANGNISVTGVTKYKEELNYTQLDNCTENGVLYYTTIGGYDAFIVARNGFDHIRQFAIVGDKRLITRRKQKETSWQPAGEWSAWEEIGGADDYNDLSNKPQIEGTTLSNNKTAAELGLQKTISTPDDYLQIYANGQLGFSSGLVIKNDVNIIPASRWRSGAMQVVNTQNDLTHYQQYLPQNCGFGLYIRIGSMPVSEYYFADSGKIYVQTADYQGSWIVSGWREIGGGSQIVSGVVNQNGTITFTDSDGNTFTTTGQSVIGPQGAPGDDYVLTAQDKADIANIVLQLLPTTQGVLYGNASN